MAGYIFSLSSGEYKNHPEKLRNEIFDKGVFSSKFKKGKSGYNNSTIEKTMADYITMSEGDDVYFLSNRKIYGVGKITKVICCCDCKMLNFPDALLNKSFKVKDIKGAELYKDKNILSYRFLFTFEGNPCFFEKGIDMDDILSYKPNSFKMLRVFSKLSFIKIDPEENVALKELLYLKSQEEYNKYISENKVVPNKTTIKKNINKVNPRLQNKYLINPNLILLNKYKLCMDNRNCEKSFIKKINETEIEVTILYDMCRKENSDLSNIIGTWDYVSRQVVASPHKPTEYIDKMDIFAMKMLDKNTNITCKYLVIEVKKDVADIETVKQVMKYVDFVAKEYAYGDYNMIEAAIIANSFKFKNDDIKDLPTITNRYFTQGSHNDVKTCEWNKNKDKDDLKFIEFKFNYDKKELDYSDVTKEYK